MTEKIVFKLNKREIIGKRVKHLRRAGVTPAVVYGGDRSSVAVEAATADFEQLITRVGTTTPFFIELDGKQRLAVIKQIERDPIKAFLKHLDLQLISAKEKIEAEVPIRLLGKGESPAERAGLVVMQVLDNIEISALPSDMVKQIEVDLANLTQVGDRIALADLKLPIGVELVDKELDPNLTVVNVYDPAELEAANEAAGGDAVADEAAVESDHGQAETADEAGQAETSAADNK